MDTSCTWQTSIPFIGLGLPELLLYDFCYLVTFLSVVWNRGWDNCMDFVLEILTDKSVLLLLGELPGIQIHCHFIATDSCKRLHDCALLIITIDRGYNVAGSRLPVLMRSRPEQRLSRLRPQCMIVSHCAQRIAQDKYSDSSRHTCTYWICCTHSMHALARDILRNLLGINENNLAWCSGLMWDSDEWLEKKGKCHKNIIAPP